MVVLEQATDPRVFVPDPRPELAHELVYVANSRNVLRAILARPAADRARPGGLGRRLGRADRQRRVVAEHLPNAELRHVYCSAGIVLNDHWDDMRAHGFVSNRIYDALACGAFVISDEVPGLAERFGDAVATYGSPDQLRELIARFLADPDERRRRGELGRQIILTRHTFAHRVRELLAIIAEQVEGSEHLQRLQAAA